MRECTKCKTFKHIKKFYKDKTKKDGIDSWCISCRVNYKQVNKERIAIHRRKNARQYQLKHHFGMSKIEYNNLAKRQKYKCGICRQHVKTLTRDLCVDHCHKTGLVRGLLCHKCNAAIGLLKDDIKLLNRAIDWIKKCPR